MKPLTPTPIPYINSRTIECDLKGFTDWLNDMADLLNYTNKLAVENWNLTQDLKTRVECLEEKVETIEGQIIEIFDRLKDHESRLKSVELAIGPIITDINNISGNIQNIMTSLLDLNWLLSIMPYNKINIPASFKIAVGNINVMSANNGTPSMSIGIFTKTVQENNDVYFN